LLLPKFWLFLSPPTFQMEHALHHLYGVDAPEVIYRYCSSDEYKIYNLRYIFSVHVRNILNRWLDIHVFDSINLERPWKINWFYNDTNHKFLNTRYYIINHAAWKITSVTGWHYLFTCFKQMRHIIILLILLVFFNLIDFDYWISPYLCRLT